MSYIDEDEGDEGTKVTKGTKRTNARVATSPHHYVHSSPRHFVHLSYNLARPKYTSPESWLERVSFVAGIPEKMLVRGPQTVIYNIHYKGELQRDGVRYVFPGFRRWQLILPFSFNRLVRSLDPAIVLINGLISPWQVIMLRMTLGPRVKFICQHHAERPFRDLRGFFSRWADKYISAYLFASKAQAEVWIKAGQISSIGKVHEVMEASSTFQFDRASEKDKKSYLWIGDLDENKDPLLVARAFAKFSKGKDVSLYMIYQQRELEDRLKEIITSSIHLVGKVEHSNLQQWYNKASYIISTSHYEGSGIAVCEALSCGCYPILTNIPSFRMMTDDGSIGKLFEAGDEPGLIKALEETAGMSDTERIVQQFHHKLSFDAIARDIINVIDNL